MIIHHDEAYYKSRKPQEDLGPLRNFLRFIWNAERKTFLDRTIADWGQVCIFYTIFFSILGAIFAFQMWIILLYIAPLEHPYFQYMDTTTKALFGLKVPFHRPGWAFENPGIVFKPSNMKSMASPIIWVTNSSISPRSKRYIRSLTDFLQEYKANRTDYDTECNADYWKSGYTDKACFFDKRSLGECGRPPYGYKRPLQPCVFLRFNKRFNWVPNYYNRSSLLPPEMPRFLKTVIKESNQFRVWVSCDGANNVDKDHIGEIEYIPAPGFPVEFFPYNGQRNYLSPIVALQFKNLTPNRLITVECNVWAFNIDHHSREFLDFQIILDV